MKKITLETFGVRLSKNPVMSEIPNKSREDLLINSGANKIISKELSKFECNLILDKKERLDSETLKGVNSNNFKIFMDTLNEYAKERDGKLKLDNMMLGMMMMVLENADKQVISK